MSLDPTQAFAQPFEMLEACHERIERMLALLDRLQAHVRQHGADDNARQAARDIMRYFDLAAPQHHLDEERHLFPVLLAAGDAALATLTRRLQEDHARMESGWAKARVVLEALACDGVPPDEPGREALLAFAALYADHLAAEEGIAYPRARPLLQGEALQEMSRDMMQRRGVR